MEKRISWNKKDLNFEFNEAFMFLHHRTQGIVLRKESRGENNQLITFYTKDFGRLEILGRAIRKISSKLKSGVEEFYLSEIEFIQGKKHKTLTDAIVLEKFNNIKKDLAKLKTAHKIAEVFIDLVTGQEKDNNVWSLLVLALTKINNGRFSASGLRIQYYWFFWNLVSILGYLPELYNCPLCHKKLEPGKFCFCPEEGGIVCESCSRSRNEKEEVSINTVKILRILLAGNRFPARKLKVSSEDLQQLKLVSDYFLKIKLSAKKR